MEYTLGLERFRSAHARDYETALEEIRAGKKESHWIWYIFPQLYGLGHSTMAMYYGIQDKDEAVAYWNDPVLSSHLREISSELLKHNQSIDRIVGYPDNMKVCSCMTLFYLVTREPLFKEVLDKFYGGQLDWHTVGKLI